MTTEAPRDNVGSRRWPTVWEFYLGYFMIGLCWDDANTPLKDHVCVYVIGKDLG